MFIFELKNRCGELAKTETKVRETVKNLMAEWEKATAGVEDALFSISEGNAVFLKTGSGDWFHFIQCPVDDHKYPWESEEIDKLAEFLATFPDVVKRAATAIENRNENLKSLMERYSL